MAAAVLVDGVSLVTATTLTCFKTLLVLVRVVLVLLVVVRAVSKAAVAAVDMDPTTGHSIRVLVAAVMAVPLQFLVLTVDSLLIRHILLSVALLETLTILIDRVVMADGVREEELSFTTIDLLLKKYYN